MLECNCALGRELANESSDITYSDNPWQEYGRACVTKAGLNEALLRHFGNDLEERRSILFVG